MLLFCYLIIVSNRLIMKAVYSKSLWWMFFLAINDSMNDLKINYN